MRAAAVVQDSEDYHALSPIRSRSATGSRSRSTSSAKSHSVSPTKLQCLSHGNTLSDLVDQTLAGNPNGGVAEASSGESSPKIGSKECGVSFHVVSEVRLIALDESKAWNLPAVVKLCEVVQMSKPPASLVVSIHVLYTF